MTGAVDPTRSTQETKTPRGPPGSPGAGGPPGKPGRGGAAGGNAGKPAGKRGPAARAWSATVEVASALARRPILPLVGVLLCSLVALLGFFLGSSGDQLFNLATYVPFLGGAWAVYAAATSTEDRPRNHLPSPRLVLAFASTALVVVVLSGLATVTLTVLGGLLVKIAFSLGPTVALAEAAWPHRALWRGLMVIDERPKAFVVAAVSSLAVALVTALLFVLLLRSLFGDAAGGLFLQGAARALGWVIISALWMRFYLTSTRPS